MVEIKLDRDQAEDFQPWNDDAEDPEGISYRKVEHAPLVVSEHRWATVYGQVWERSDGTFWRFDYERSHSESAEPWSYIEPHLVRVQAVSTTTYVEFE